MSKLRKFERYFYIGVTFLFATYMGKESLETESLFVGFLCAIISVGTYMYAAYFIENLIRKCVELDHFTEE